MTKMNIVLLGPGSVGKSALTVQYVQGFFVKRYDPTIEDSYPKIVQIEEKTYTLEILDTAGTDSFSSMRDLYIKSGDGFVLVYSILSPRSLVEVSEIHEQILRVKDKEPEDVPCLLVGNKCDLVDQRAVLCEVGRETSRRMSAGFLESSAKTCYNVDNIFIEIVKRIEKSRQKTFNENEKERARTRKKCTLL